METVDIFIPCIYKDLNKLNYGIPSLCRFFNGLGNIYISMPDKMNMKDFVLDGHEIKFYNDMDVLPCPGIARCRFRPNWIYQQLLKLLENVTRTEYVMPFDADCVLLRDFSVFDDITGRPKLYSKPNVKDESAFLRYIAKATAGDLAPYEEQSRYCVTKYIADKQLFKKSIIEEMIGKYFKTKQVFIDFTIDNSRFNPADPKNSLFISEYEMYGRYIEKYHLDDVAVSFLKQDRVDKSQMSQGQSVFSDEEIRAAIENSSKGDFDALLIQSNCANCDVMYRASGVQK